MFRGEKKKKKKIPLNTVSTLPAQKKNKWSGKKQTNTSIVSVSSFFPHSSGRGKEAFGRREGRVAEKFSFLEALVSQVFFFFHCLLIPFYLSFSFPKAKGYGDVAKYLL